MTTDQKVSFDVDGFQLNGAISLPDEGTDRAAMILHPHPLYGGDMNNHVVLSLSNLLSEMNFAVMRFDFRGATSSPSGYSGVTGAVADARAGLEVLKEIAGTSNVGVLGYSFGGSVTLRLGSRIQSSFLVALSASYALILEDVESPSFLADITEQVFLLHGARDQMVPPEDLTRIADIVGKRAEHLILENENHFYLHSMNKVTDEIRRFIQGLS
ncbi:MAG: hypothetical protein RTU30_09860 [Candidatus Thorarchaeota archaeon]